MWSEQRFKNYYAKQSKSCSVNKFNRRSKVRRNHILANRDQRHNPWCGLSMPLFWIRGVWPSAWFSFCIGSRAGSNERQLHIYIDLDDFWNILDVLSVYTRWQYICASCCCARPLLLSNAKIDQKAEQLVYGWSSRLICTRIGIDQYLVGVPSKRFLLQFLS